MRWEARLREVVEGSPRRAHLEAAARRGNAIARKALEEPQYPETVAYLYDWVLEVHGRSGADMSGPTLLSYTTIEAWARLTHRAPTAQEVEALMLLDGVLRFPDAGREDG